MNSFKYSKQLLLLLIGLSCLFTPASPTNADMFSSPLSVAVPLTEPGPLYTPEQQANLELLTPVNKLIFFYAYTAATGTELWKSDGTPQGTSIVKDINPGSAGSFPKNLYAVNGSLFFTILNPGIGFELWKSDGSSQGTLRVKDFPNESGFSLIENLTAFQNHVFFTLKIYGSTPSTSLWKSDGTTEGTVLVKPIDASNLIVFKQSLFFSGSDPATGTELWQSDGTSEGTTLVKDINPGTGSSYLYNLMVFNNTLFLIANDGTTGEELWKSDGTTQGTQLIKDIFPGQPSGLTAFHLVFCSSFSIIPYGFKDRLFFAANDGIHGYELWESDGTAQGTKLNKDINPGIGDSYPYQFTVINDHMFFVANDQVHGYELWTSDGSSDGTQLLKDINPQGSSIVYTVPTQGSVLCPSFAYYMPLINNNNQLFFDADDGVHGRELWMSDGSPQGTVLLHDLIPGTGNATPLEITPLGTRIIFQANATEDSIRLWSVISYPYKSFLPLTIARS